MAQARHIEQSAALAQAVEAALRERVPMSPRAIQQAPFRVLVGANMPAVLVEMGFITNPEQEKQLAVRRVPERDRPGARRRHRPRSATARGAAAPARRAGDRSAPLMLRRAVPVVAIAAVAIAGAWLLFVGLPRWYGRSRAGAAAPPRAGAAGAERKITATLYYVVGRRHVARRRAARGAVRRAGRRAGAADRRGAARRRAARRSRPPFPAGTTLRGVFMTERRTRRRRSSISSAEVRDQASRRRARRAVHGLRHRQRADREPAGDPRVQILDRRQGSRHARRPRRPAPSARRRT